MARKSVQTVTGRYSRHPDGYGFVRPQAEEVIDADVFIPPSSAGEALHGDLVMASVRTSRRGGRGRSGASRRSSPRWEGEILRVVERPRRRAVGEVFAYRKRLFVRPVDDRLGFEAELIDAPPDLPEGVLVSFFPITQPESGQRPLAEYSETLGDPSAPDMPYKIICTSHGIPLSFPPQVERAAQRLHEPSEGDREGRLDLRLSEVFTIDGRDARDFDDAVSIEKISEGEWKLGVHIADVGVYVSFDSLIDEDARRRGTSVYFPDRAVPMLPERLSNDLCSLRPQQDRLCISIFMHFDERGRRFDKEVAETVICSRHRLTYRQVQAFFDDASSSDAGALPGSSLHLMLELSRRLRSRRLANGAIDLELPEARVVLDDEGRVLDIARAPRFASHQLIEEFMLAANEAAAEYLEENQVPSLFRIHEEPDAQKVEAFQEAAGQFGYWLQGGREGRFLPRQFQALLLKMASAPEHRFLAYLMLRSFKQARYSPVNLGHFGLASPLYTHFTSPIRRYPDLMVHRLIRLTLRNRHKTAAARHLYAQLGDIAEESSERERSAVEAERQMLKWKQAEFMSERLGEEYIADVTSVRPNGFFVQLKRHFVEGFVPVATMIDDFYIFNPKAQILRGEQRGRVVRMGDSVRVRVDRVDRRRQVVDFSLAESLPRKNVPGRSSASGRKRSKRDKKSHRRKGRRRR